MHQFLRNLIRPYRGSNRLSRYLRSRIEKLNIRQTIGVQLAGLTFLAAVVVPGADQVTSAVGVMKDTQQTVVEIEPTTETKYIWPLSRFQFSQGFHYGHPGIDITAPSGTPVMAIAEGVISKIVNSSWGYGKHVFVDHPDNVKSLYAHLSFIDPTIKAGASVAKGQVVGGVGITGWATGYHLHLEIYENGIPVNPIEVLPSVK